jgi:putative ATP-dependent endonuclease of OLD family
MGANYLGVPGAVPKLQRPGQAEMFLAHLTIENFRCFGEGNCRLELSLNRGLTALVGENDAGKTAVIDALRLALGTTDQEWNRLDEADFCSGTGSREIKIVCRFEGLDVTDKRTLIEYLTYRGGTEEPVFYFNWTARESSEGTRGIPHKRVEVHSGREADGPAIASEVREMLRATYLRPLRDAGDEMSAGRGSRLSQVLHYTDEIRNTGSPYDPKKPVSPTELNVLGIGFCERSS